ncbi:MAG: ribose-phosphate diphosphokinase [Candidatus Diapherotrites archaeon]
MKMIIGLRNSIDLAKKMAKKKKIAFSLLETRNFPDGESYLRFATPVKGNTVYLVQSLHPDPNNSLIELVFAARGARAQGAKRIVGVVPYLAYMRQDKRFKDGEVISSRHMALLLERSLDELITVDPHLHRYNSLSELFSIPAKKLSAVEEVAKYIDKKFPKNTVIIGPDEESFQWALVVATLIKHKAVIFTKRRSSSRKVNIKIKEGFDWKGKEIVIIDDIISTGHTMVETVKELKRRKVKAVHCICVHGILAEGALKKLKKAGAKSVVSCNTIPSPTNKIDLSGLIAKELR